MLTSKARPLVLQPVRISKHDSVRSRREFLHETIVEEVHAVSSELVGKHAHVLFDDAAADAICHEFGEEHSERW